MGLGYFVLLLCLVFAHAYQEAFNWVGNGQFKSGLPATHMWGSYGPFEIVTLASRGLKPPPVDDAEKPQFALRFPPRRGGGEYEIHPVTSMGRATRGKYIISAWVYITNRFNGDTLTLHSRWWSSGWRQLGTTGGRLNPRIRNKWQYVETSFTCSRQPMTFSLYLGYPANHRKGELIITNVRISKYKACKVGYYKKHGKCQDKNECQKNNGGCDPRTKCLNHPGGFTCSQCPNGFYRPQTSTQICKDVNECLSNNGGCAAHSICINSQGSFRCGRCAKGYSGDPNLSCEDVDECERAGACDSKRECINTMGSFKCGQCKVGFRLAPNGNTCEDVNECETNNGGCDDMTECINKPGASECGDCPFGYYGDGKAGCVDVDECKEKNGGCDPMSNCINTPGSRECSACPKGFTGNGADGCTKTQKEKRETKEDIANMASVNAAQRTATMYDSTRKNWVEEGEKLKKTRAETKEIKTLAGRLATLKYVTEVAGEDRLKKEAEQNLAKVKDLEESGKQEVTNIYAKHFQETTTPVADSTDTVAL